MGEKLKQCSRGDQCVHLDGPSLPATLEYFRWCSKVKSGLCSRCKACERDYAKKYSREHKDEISARMRKYYKNNVAVYAERGKQWRENNKEYDSKRHVIYHAVNREERAEKGKKWREENLQYCKEQWQRWTKANPGKHAAASREYRKNNADKCAEQGRVWRSKNRTKTTEYNYIRRTLRRDLPFDFTVDDEVRALDYFNNCCAVCERSFDGCESAMDHWIALSDPREDNPGTVPTNMVPLCHGVGGCNNKKSNLNAEYWLRREFGEEQAQEILNRVEQYFNCVRSE